MDCTISYYSESVQEEIFALPDTLAARYIVLTRRIVALGDGLFELRLKGAEGIARIFFCTLVGKRVVMLHSFVKISAKPPPRERLIAESRMNEVRHENS